MYYSTWAVCAWQYFTFIEQPKLFTQEDFRQAPILLLKTQNYFLEIIKSFLPVAFVVASLAFCHHVYQALCTGDL